MSDETLHLADRLALSLAEAASVIGVAEGTLRSVLHEIPHCRVGRRVVIPVEELREWLRDESRQERNRVDAAAEKVLESFE
jgi:excisionase family DNA binding protein